MNSEFGMVVKIADVFHLLKCILLMFPCCFLREPISHLGLWDHSGFIPSLEGSGFGRPFLYHRSGHFPQSCLRVWLISPVGFYDVVFSIRLKQMEDMGLCF